MALVQCFCTKSVDRIRKAWFNSTGEELKDEVLFKLAGQKLLIKDFDKATRSGKVQDPENPERWVSLLNCLICIGGPITATPERPFNKTPPKSVQNIKPLQKRDPVQKNTKPKEKLDPVTRLLQENEKAWKDRKPSQGPRRNELKEQFMKEDKKLDSDFKQMCKFTSALEKMGETIRERKRQKERKLIARKISLVPVICEPISEMPFAHSDSISNSDIETFHSEGAICLRGIIDKETIESMRNSVGYEQARSQNLPISSLGKFDSPYDTKSGFNSLLMCLKSSQFYSFANQSKLRNIAQRFMRSDTSTLLYDHIIIKNKSHTYHTSWHFDLNYWPLEGDDMVSMWIILDDCPCDAGLLQFVRGSHLQEHTNIPHVEGLRGRGLDVMGMANMQAGDAMLFWGKTLHGASGNVAGAGSRRAISLRFLGDNVWFDPEHTECPPENYAYAKGVLMGSMFARNRSWIKEKDKADEE